MHDASSSHKPERCRGQKRGHLLEAFRLPRRDDDERVALVQERFDQRQQRLVFPFHRRSQDEEFAAGDEGFDLRRELERRGVGFVVELDVAGHFDGGGRGSDCDEAIAVDLLAGQDAVVVSQHAADD